MGTGRITISSLQKIAVGIERRGPHAWGMSWIDSVGRIHSYKAPGSILEGLDIIDKLGDFDPSGVIMHTRYSTHGSPEFNENNHPHPSDGGWFVHNGQIPNWRELIHSNNLMPLTDCDSEVLGLMAQCREGSLIRRWRYAINQCELTRPLCVAGLWSRPMRAILAKRGNPLMLSRGTTGNMYFSSLREGMPGKPKRAPESRLVCFDLNQQTTSFEALTPWIDTGVNIAGSGSAMSRANSASRLISETVDRHTRARTILDDAGDQLSLPIRSSKRSKRSKRAKKIDRRNGWDI